MEATSFESLKSAGPRHCKRSSAGCGGRIAGHHRHGFETLMDPRIKGKRSEQKSRSEEKKTQKRKKNNTLKTSKEKEERRSKQDCLLVASVL